MLHMIRLHKNLHVWFRVADMRSHGALCAQRKCSNKISRSAPRTPHLINNNRPLSKDQVLPSSTLSLCPIASKWSETTQNAMHRNVLVNDRNAALISQWYQKRFLPCCAYCALGVSHVASMHPS